MVEVGGLDRADARGGLTDDVDDLAGHLGKNLTADGRGAQKEASTT